MKKLFQILFPLMLLPAVLWVFLNASLNWHYHRLPNGQIICHAHPYSVNHVKTPMGDIPVEKHKHNENEFLFYAQVVHPQTLVFFALFVLSIALHGSVRHFTPEIIPKAFSGYYCYVPARGPPSFH